MNFIYHRFKSIATIFFVLIAFVSQAQVIVNAVKWNYSVNRINDEEAELIFKADIGAGWHLYSQFLPEAETRPVPTSFNFTSSKEYERVGKVKESKTIKKYEDAFEMELQYFEKSATFTQKIKVKSKDPFTIKGTLEFMVCNDQQCLPPEEKDFEFKLDKAKGTVKLKEVTGSIDSTTGSTTTASATADTNKITRTSVTDTSKQVAAAAPVNKNETQDQPRSLWGTFLLSFFGGFAAIIMPCIFPMIPLTVSFFTKQSKNKKKGLFNSFMYGSFIIGIYVCLGLLITIIFGDEALNKISSNEWMNLFFFIIFVIFGISFLGAFEITLPASWINKADAASEKGGMMGIFFMAFTLALVSFSCTGPIIGSLLVEASHGGRLGPAVGMFGFALALALPFTLFAAFPGWLNSLPKSGGWLNNVKVVLGLLELAFALKFLSVTDLQGLHIDFLDFHINGPLGILKREVFIALWIVIFALIGFYLLGKIRFSHDSEQQYVSVPKIMLAIIAFGFVVYLVPGMWGAPLKLISGFPPPSFHSEHWDIGSSNSNITVNDNSGADSLRPPSDAHCPHGINCFNDYDQALAYAKKVGKPLMVDFTGWACVNCRKMEENVWIDPGVLKRIKNDYVLVSLYVDESTPLPADKQYTSKLTERKVKTVGNKWAELEASRYNKISQPWYVLLDHNEKELTEGRGYDTDIAAYIKFLDDGLAEFKKRMTSAQEKK